MNSQASKEYLQIAFLCAACIALIVLYGSFRCHHPDFTDPLTKSMWGAPWDRFVDGWGISHFGFFTMLGFLFPLHWILLWFLGVAWEIVEFSMKDHPFYLSDCQVKLQTDEGSPWWYGRWQDIVMNSLGIATGVGLHTFLQPKKTPA